MKNHGNFLIILLLILGVLCAFSGYAQNPYITVWKTDNESTFGNFTQDNQILIPATGEFSYSWQELDSDGNTINNTGSGEANDEFTLTFPHPGIYRLKMTPTGENPFNQISFLMEAGKIIRIEQWGDIPWNSFNTAYSQTKNLKITATDVPDLNLVTDMTGAFMESNVDAIPNMNDWNVSQVEDMGSMFYLAPNFNNNISNWEVSQVTDMTNMFRGAINFNQPLANWDVSSVTDMTAMFDQAESFNQPIEDWDVSNVTDMHLMFSMASSFNQPIGDWDVSNVTNMFGTFFGASIFDQPLADWNVGSVTAMDAMFAQAVEFNQPIGEWNVSNVMDMGSMFSEATNFNQPIGNWDVSSVKRMAAMFSGATSFEQDISNWEVSNVTTMNSMFGHAIFNLPIGDWDVSSVNTMERMFQNNFYFNQPLENWQVNQVANMAYMFAGATKFNQPLNNWNVDLYNAVGIFHRAVSFNQPLPDWNLQHLIVTEETIDQDGTAYENSFSFAFSGMNCNNYSETIQGWSNNPETSNWDLILLAEEMQYSPEIIDDRQNLIDAFNWSIIGDNQGNCSLSADNFDIEYIDLFPNPVKNKLMVEGLKGNESLRLFDINGRLIQQNVTTETSYHLEMQDYAAGIYFLQIQSENGNQVTKKILKK